MANFIRTFGEMSRDDFQLAGGKAANLGELTQAGFNVPPGFCVTSTALPYVIEANGLQPQIDALAQGLDPEDMGNFDDRTARIRDLINTADIPADLLGEIRQAITNLCAGDDPFVAVRSSVAVKDSRVSSFPGMMDTYHYLRGQAEILEHIQRCWASLWTSRAATTRHYKSIEHDRGLIVSIVQRMVHSEIAGVLFTANPINASREEMILEANWGLGESVVSGKSMNDYFVLTRNPLAVKERKIVRKSPIVVFDQERGRGRKEIEPEPHQSEAPTLSDDQLLDLGGRHQQRPDPVQTLLVLVRDRGEGRFHVDVRRPGHTGRRGEARLAAGCDPVTRHPSLAPLRLSPRDLRSGRGLGDYGDVPGPAGAEATVGEGGHGFMEADRA